MCGILNARSCRFRSSRDTQTDRVHIWRELDALKVENLTEEPLLLQSLKSEGQEQLLNVVVDGGETVELHPSLARTGPSCTCRPRDSWT